jgi:glycosyltransferase involved in cell wall biosynthesis
MNGFRIVHLGKFYAPVRGGMETVLQTLCRGEVGAVETRALVMNRSRKTSHDVIDGVSVTRVASLFTVGSVAVAPTLPLWLARARADLIVLHEPNPMALLAYFIARPRAPLIVWYHSEVVRPAWRYRLFYRPLLDFALRRAARVVVASPPMADAPAPSAHREKCVVIPYGLDVDRYRPTAAIAARADALRAQARGPILLFVGRLVQYKGLDVLLRAMAELDAQLVIVGDGPLRGTLETMVQELGVGHRVHLTGEVTDDERLAWLQACEALVLPSVTRQESFGVAQLEAMVCGRPVVSTDVPTGVPWVNVHGETGLVVPAGDVTSLRGALERLVADAELRHALGSTARTRVLSMFTADRMYSSMLALYREVVAPVLLVQPARDRSEIARDTAREYR